MNLMTTAMTNTTHMLDSAENTIDIQSGQVCAHVCFKLVLFEGCKVYAGAHLFVLICGGIFSFLKQEPYTKMGEPEMFLALPEIWQAVDY